MITKVNKIKDFGVFRNFSWQTAIPEFKQFNLIYGWNYSGKTTFSRVFRCLELSKLHDDYLTATFELEDGASNKYDQTFATTPLIKVFNSDFIRDNLKWDAENIEAIFMLGIENVELQKELKEKKEALEKTEVELLQDVNANNLTSSNIEGLLSRKAGVVGDLLSFRPFTKVHLRPIVDKVKGVTATYTLSPMDFDKYKSQALSTERKLPITEVAFTTKELSTFNSAVELLLHKQVTAETIAKLLADASLSSWVETGRELHKGKTVCEFCGNTIDAKRIEDLNKHFSKDFEQLKADIGIKIKELETALINLSPPLSAEASFYVDLQTEYTPTKSTLETEVKKYNDAINSLIKDLQCKKEKPFDKLEVTAFTDNKTELAKAVTTINAVIKKNNERTTDFDIQKEAAVEKLKDHFAAEFETAEKCSATLAAIAAENVKIEAKKVSITDQKAKVLEIENKLSETVKGAETVNKYLKIFFGKDDIEIKVTTENKFELLRDQQEAKNLSEGEKTAIAFAYFTAKLEERENKINDSIIYIDDPISSLDSNHLFNLYSFIKNKFVDSKQLFICTHNFEFFNLLKEWFLSNKDIKKDNRALFLIERPNNGIVRDAEIKCIHKLLEDFKSEYHFLFWLIYRFKETPSTDFTQLYNLPNLMRRYLEAFLGFKVPKHVGLETKLEFLIEDKIVRERVLKFIHHYSHGNSMSRALNFPDLQECTDIVKIVIDSVENKDKTHFDSLVEIVSPIELN